MLYTTDARLKSNHFVAQPVWIERIKGLADDLNVRYDRCGSVPDRSQPQRRRRREIDGNVFITTIIVHRNMFIEFILWLISRKSNSATFSFSENNFELS